MKKIKNNRFLAFLLIILMSVSLVAGCAEKGQPEPAPEKEADKFPERPITLKVGFGAGGLSDVQARLLASEAEKELGVPIIIENEPGGGSTVSLGKLSQAEPDGYTLGIIGQTPITVTPILDSVPYKPFESFDFINGYGMFRYGIFSRTDSPYNTIQDVIEEARKRPGEITYASFAMASALALKKIELEENIKLTMVPVKSGQEGITSLLGGHVDLCIGAPELIKPLLLETKEAKIVAVAGSKRWDFAPDVKTLMEDGYDIDVSTMWALGAPAGVPKERLQKINDAWKKAHEVTKAKQTELHVYANFVSGEEMKSLWQKRVEEWRPLLEQIKAETK